MSGLGSGGVRQLGMLAWSVAAGLPLGVSLGYLMATRGFPFGLSSILSVVVASLFVYVGTNLVVLVGFAPIRLFFPKSVGAETSPAYLSRVRSLSERGEFELAHVVLEEALAKNPSDHHALLGLSRLYGKGAFPDEEKSLEYLRAAIDSGGLGVETEALKRRQLSERLLEGPEPKRAAPELARLADGFAGSPHAAWAVRELAVLKRQMQDEE